MKTSWILGLATVLALNAPLVACAQAPSDSPSPSGPQGGPGGHHHGGMQRMLSQLNLTADQKAKIQKISQDQSLDRKGRMDAIMAVLTPEQQAQLKAMMQQHHHGPPPGGGPAPNQ